MYKLFARRLFFIAFLLGSGLQPAWGGFLDQLKEKAEGMAKDVVEGTSGNAADRQADNRREPPNTKAPPPSTPTPSKAKTDASPLKAGDSHGRWQGTLNERSVNHRLASAGFEIVLSDSVDVARVSQLGRRCLAELRRTDTPGEYRARFVQGQQTCGNTATIALKPDGVFKVTWIDAPGVAGKTMGGKIERTYPSHPRREWSSTLEERRANDIVGFYPGMTYEQARSHWQAEHQDLKREMRWVRDDGTSAIVIILSPKERAKAGQVQLNEQITLGFESQTADELPKVDNPGGSVKIEDLRRANARLMYVHREVQFADRKGPILDTLRAALTKKYGPPSVDKKTAYRDMQWSYDQSNQRIANAKGGVCDHWQRYSNRDLAPNYKPAQAARVPYVTVHPECGLTIKVRVQMYDGAVRQLDTVVYDQQRLMGDQWYGLKRFNAALLAKHRAKAKAMQQQKAPDL